MARDSFFSYFPPSPAAQNWEAYATSFGRIQMPEKSAVYPPDSHPSGHHFLWKDGRILADCQLLSIQTGAGEFESALSPRVRIPAGTTVVLHPGVWHRYRPHPGTGWTESWIELRGPLVDRLIKSDLFDPGRPVYPGSRSLRLEEGWERAYAMARSKPSNFTVRLGLIGLDLLVQLQEKPGAAQVRSRVGEIVSLAQTKLSEEGVDPDSIESLAAKLGVGYSHFRRAFKAQTGFSPKQYQNEVRFRQVKELLANTSLSIKEISVRRGYSSPYHLTKDFTMRAKVAPSAWRANLLRRKR